MVHYLGNGSKSRLPLLEGFDAFPFQRHRCERGSPALSKCGVSALSSTPQNGVLAPIEVAQVIALLCSDAVRGWAIRPHRSDSDKKELKSILADLWKAGRENWRRFALAWTFPILLYLSFVAESLVGPIGNRNVVWIDLGIVGVLVLVGIVARGASLCGNRGSIIFYFGGAWASDLWAAA